jgi:hypothetical protein
MNLGVNLSYCESFIYCLYFKRLNYLLSAVSSYFLPIQFSLNLILELSGPGFPVEISGAIFFVTNPIVSCQKYQ